MHSALRILFLMASLMITAHVNAQITQTVRGVVVDKETGTTLPGANLSVVSDTINVLGAAADENGNFRIDNVPVGKLTLKISYIGYSDRFMDLNLTSAKEIVLRIELEESVTQMAEVEVFAVKRGEVNNEMAVVSSRTFDVSETERYAGSRGDPARMASNFAGVQGADDSRNDIVVRGNSPLGVIYKLEGFDIPNPNHFSIAGSSGGPVSILNNKVLSNSDFFTSAFPAEYGNSTAAVFDIRLRNGNNEKREFSGQLGFLGTELALEGPFSKKSKASYLIVYRYSTLAIFKKLGLSIGTDAVPGYQDGSFKFNFPLKNGANLSFFGIGGTSKIDIMISDQVRPATDFYGDDDRDQHFNTRMGVLGTNYTKTLNAKTLFKTGLALSQEQQHAKHDYIIRHLNADSTFHVDSIYKMMEYTFRINKLSWIASFNTKLNKNHVLKYGINAHYMMFNMQDSALNYAHTQWQNRWNYEGGGVLAQAYLQWKWKPTEDFVVTAGVFGQFLSISKSLSVPEPRIGIKYNINNKQSINIGAGLHSQAQPWYTYFYNLTDTSGNAKMPHNTTMDFTKSLHSVIGYDLAINPTTRIKAEAYYQYIYNIPVELNPSSFSLANMGSGFARFFPDSLQNTGTGRNYGVELTIEKFFNKSFYFLITGSLYDAKYRGSDDTLRNTDYNGKYAANFLVGKEFKTGERSVLSLGTKFTVAGGKWYGNVDTAASNLQNDLVYYDAGYNSKQFKSYYRLDFKINFKINAKKVTHEFALDLVNVLNVQNILSLSYSPDPTLPPSQQVRENYQLGFLPLFYYRVDF